MISKAAYDNIWVGWKPIPPRLGSDVQNRETLHGGHDCRYWMLEMPDHAVNLDVIAKAFDEPTIVLIHRDRKKARSGMVASPNIGGFAVLVGVLAAIDLTRSPLGAAINWS